ncbi:hypothetical protein ADUPG1_010477, partial [Aduncisulcus paluster]
MRMDYPWDDLCPKPSQVRVIKKEKEAEAMILPHNAGLWFSIIPKIVERCPMLLQWEDRMGLEPLKIDDGDALRGERHQEVVKRVWCLGIQWYLDGVKVVKKKKKSVLAVKMGIINLPFEERKLNKWIFEVATVDDTPEAMTEVLEAIKVEMERLQNGTYCGSNLTEKRVFDDVIREEWASVRADKPEISCDDYLAWCTSKGIIPVFFVGIILYMDGVQIDGRGGTALCVRFTLCNFA